jgi:endoglucanase Acf2
MRAFKYLYILLLSATVSKAQTAVSVGAGSYASSIPAEKNVDTDSRTKYVLSGVTGAYPTNKWWTALMTTNLLGTNGSNYHIWAEPANYTVQPYGLGVHYATTWDGDADHQLMASPDPLQLRAANFTPTGSQLVKQWSDWTVAFRLQESTSKYMDITLGHGMPYTWIEYTGITTPQIATTNAPATYFNSAGSTQTFPFTGDQLGIEWNGRVYAVFAPAGTQFTLSGATVSVTFAGGVKNFLAVAVMPARSSMATFYANAYSIPRNTTVTPTYDEENGLVHTDWAITTEALKTGASGNIIQGWLPHHYKNTTYNATFSGIEYATPRGKMKCAAGNSFRFTYKFKGVLAQLPAPEAATGTNAYNAATLNQRINNYAAAATFGADSYGGGKDMTMAAQYLTYASQTNNTSLNTIKTKLRAELVNWFTYTPGEANKYYARMPNWGALLGEEQGYGSEQFNDHHFHYGYHVYAAAVLGMYDADFLSQYAPMAKTVAKEFANWDRTDTNFPFFRTLDLWEGHSWANGGYGFNPPFGPDQESTSEAMMSWAGVFLLGSVTNDADLRKAGAMGYVMESAAASEYWFNRDNDNFPPAWGPAGKLASIVHGSQLEYQTFFGLNPCYVHGIQYIPVLPSSYYLVRNPTAAKTEFEYMRTRSVANGYGDLGNFSPNPVDKLWDNLSVRYIALFDQERAAALPEMGTAPGDLGLTYYQVHSNRTLGNFAWDHYIGAGQSGVFYNPTLNQYTYMAYNPSTTAKTYNVYQNGAVKGTITVPARSFYSTHTLGGGGTTNPPVPVNLALNHPVTVSSVENADYPATNAVDGSYASRWSSAFSDPQWLYVDLGATYTINEVKLTWEAAYAANYQIQVSADAVSWTDAKVVSGNTTLTNDHTGLSASGRYVRIYCTSRGTVYGYSLYELEVYGTPGGSTGTACAGTAANGDYSYEVSTTNGNVSWKFVPLSPIAGSTLAIIYVREGASGQYAGYTMSDFTFSHAQTPGATLSFYFTYRVGATTVERNSSASPHAYTVGTTCAIAAGLSTLATAKLTETDNSRFHVYPNPAHNELYFSGTGKRLINVYDATGKKVYTTYTNSSRISVSALQTGVYWLECVEGDKRNVKSFIKQ